MILQEELEGIEFLRNLGDQHLARIAMQATLKEYTPGSVVFGEGQDSSSIYFVLSGEIALSVKEDGGQSVEVYTARAGELIGWSPVLGRHAMTATAQAKTPCRLAVLDASQILEMCQTYPRFGLAFLREIGVTLSDRLQGTRRRLAGAIRNRTPMASIVEGSD